MNVARFLNQAAGSMSAVYRIVFTGLLLYELVRYQWRRKDAEVHHHRGYRGDRRNRRALPLEEAE